jgi:hypothetical protein
LCFITIFPSSFVVEIAPIPSAVHQNLSTIHPSILKVEVKSDIKMIFKPDGSSRYEPAFIPINSLVSNFQNIVVGQ